MNKDFVEVANDSGTNNGSFDVVCEKNSGDERSTILTVSGEGVNKTINITQKASNLESIDIAGGSYASNGSLVTIVSFGMLTNIKVSMTSPQMGTFTFPIPVQKTYRTNRHPGSLLRIRVNEEIPSHYNGEKVVAFLERANGNTIYTPKKELTVEVYRDADKNAFDLDIAGGITLGNTEIIDINSALHNRPNIAILLTNNKTIQLTNFIWQAVHHDS